MPDVYNHRAFFVPHKIRRFPQLCHKKLTINTKTMIEKKDYLKSYMRMDALEKLEYIAQVERWTEETYPRLAALDDSWKDADVKDFDEGLKLVTALQKAQGYLNTYQRYDIKKRLEVLRKLLQEVRIKSGMSKVAFRPQNDTRRYTAIVPPAPKVNEEGVTVKRDPYKQPEVGGRRPEHVSQYKHLLSDGLKKEASEISSKYDLMAHWKQRAEFLAVDPRANKALISNAAKKVVRIEQQILNFWQRVDAEYAKATGEKIDETEMRELAEEAAKLAKEPKTEITKVEIEAMEEGEEKENAKRSRIEANKKYLRRNDAKPTDARKEQVRVRVMELLEWGIELPSSAYDVCNKYGIELPKEDKDSEMTVNEPMTAEVGESVTTDEVEPNAKPGLFDQNMEG